MAISELEDFRTCQGKLKLLEVQDNVSHQRSRVYLGVRTCDILLCFGAFVFLLFIVFDALCCFVRSLFYVTGEFHRFLHRG